MRNSFAKTTYTSLAVASIVSVGITVLPLIAKGAPSESARQAMVQLNALNRSGVTGTAEVVLKDKTLTVTFDAMGLQPNMVHDAHIHGMLNGSAATCPTMAQDTNGDGYVSVFEGAPAYGPIKVSLSNPITPPGVNKVTALFAPFAGMDSNNFQNADGQGMDHYNQSFSYNLSDPEAAAAYKGIMPIKAQEIVIHGAMAPESVDTIGGSTTKMVYDELLPVACADLQHAMENSTMSMPSMDMPVMDMPVDHGMSDNIDQQISAMYAARNAKIDTLNQAGDVVARDLYLAKVDVMIASFTKMMNR